MSQLGAETVERRARLPSVIEHTRWPGGTLSFLQVERQ